MLTFMKKEDGFTLIEIMVVLVILGILATISVPVYSNYVRKAKISEAISNVSAYANAIRIYRMETGSWPTKADITGDAAKKAYAVSVDENYFTITWTSNATTGLTMTITNNNFDVACTFTYVIDPDYKGTWNDDATEKILENYAPQLLKLATT